MYQSTNQARTSTQLETQYKGAHKVLIQFQNLFM